MAAREGLHRSCARVTSWRIRCGRPAAYSRLVCYRLLGPPGETPSRSGDVSQLPPVDAWLPPSRARSALPGTDPNGSLLGCWAPIRRVRATSGGPLPAPMTHPPTQTGFPRRTHGGTLRGYANCELEPDTGRAAHPHHPVDGASAPGRADHRPGDRREWLSLDLPHERLACPRRGPGRTGRPSRPGVDALAGMGRRGAPRRLPRVDWRAPAGTRRTQVLNALGDAVGTAAAPAARERRGMARLSRIRTHAGQGVALAGETNGMY